MTNDPLSVCCQHLAKSQTLLDEKDAEIAQLKEAIRRLAAQDATLSVCDGNVTVTMDATLTDEEREAVRTAVRMAGDPSPITAPQVFKYAATLRSLLERVK